jgi:hypothetical protein
MVAKIDVFRAAIQLALIVLLTAVSFFLLQHRSRNASNQS